MLLFLALYLRGVYFWLFEKYTPLLYLLPGGRQVKLEDGGVVYYSLVSFVPGCQKTRIIAETLKMKVLSLRFCFTTEHFTWLTRRLKRRKSSRSCSTYFSLSAVITSAEATMSAMPALKEMLMPRKWHKCNSLVQKLLHLVDVSLQTGEHWVNAFRHPDRHH